MGTVYRARDTLSGLVVALKVLHGGASSDDAPERFGRESRVLAELQHPDIVRWIAHGVEPPGQRYLAMEWLQGECLEPRLRRAAIGVDDSVLLLRRIASALGVAHRRGIVHRDVKPSNVFLVDGRTDRPKILDFGIAKMRGDDELRTTTGAVLGTPGYMSPEQARGEREVGPTSDVFSLGVLLYRCLSGKLPFAGRDPLAFLMRVILEEPTPLRELRPEVPRALEEIVARMLSKSPERRPADGGAVADALAALGEITLDLPASELHTGVASITTGEKRVLCMVLMRLAPAHAPAVEPIDGTVRTISLRPSERNATLRKAAEVFAGKVESLIDGSVVVAFAGSESLAEQSVRAARCAFALRDAVPNAPIALVAGRVDLAAGLRAGDVIDRGVSLLDVSKEGSIRLDDVTASLLEARFSIGRDASGLFLLAERTGGGAVRTLLGKPTPLVGRERELQNLESILRESIDEPIARAVLVTAPAGFGKSRLRYELLRRVERLEDRVTVLTANGDPMSAGAPYSMIRPAIKRVADIHDGEPLASRQAKLQRRVAQHVTPGEVQRVAEFLGELVDSPFADDDSVQLRAARRDPILMGDQIRRAWEDFMRAECESNPVLVVLEDLHWGDQPSVRLVDSTLRLLADRPLMVLALARPEVRDLFPRLWAERGLEEVRIGELTPRAAEKLVRQALQNAEDRVVARVVERAEGNAFYLEELIRAAAEGDSESSPGSVLGMVQARLEALDTDARRVLRAAAVFGHTFERGGLAALLGDDDRLDEWLRDLVARETFSDRGASRVPGDRKFAFRHALVRDAAYAMLIDDDRRLGHRLAAEWLERVGSTPAAVLAEHWERADRPEQASRFYQRAAEDSLEANDFEATIALADRAIAGGAQGEARGVMRTLQAEAHRWRGELVLAEERGVEALSLLPKSSARWCRAASEVAVTSGRRGHRERITSVGRELLEVVAGAEPNSARLVAAMRTAVQLFYTGHYALATEFLDRLERDAEAQSKGAPDVAARLEQMRVAKSIAGGDLSERRRRSALAVESFRIAGDLRMACTQELNLGYADIALGQHQTAVDALQVVLASAERMGLANVVAVAKHNLGLALMRLGRFEEARAYEAEAVIAVASHGDRRIEGGSRLYLAMIHLGLGDHNAAEVEAREAVRVTEALPPTHAHALAALASVLVKSGRADEALRYAREASELLASLGRVDDGEALIYLTLAEALEATGDQVNARSAIADAKRFIEGMASRIADGPLRQSFLSEVPESARILALARAWGPIPA